MGAPVSAETLRLATWKVSATRDGPGLLARDAMRGTDDVRAIAATIAAAAPDVIVLQDWDFDRGGVALAALGARLAEAGHPMPHRFAGPPNTGRDTGRDLDGDGRLRRARDAHGYGRFPGAGAMAVLSTRPLTLTEDATATLWADLPGARAPPGTWEGLRLSTTAHWRLAVGGIEVVAFHATPPVFDGPEDRNGLRNADELRLALAMAGRAAAPVVMLGDWQVDPARGDGRRATIRALLADPAWVAAGDGAATCRYGRDVGDLRVSYVLAARAIAPRASGQVWPDPATGARCALLWADVPASLDPAEGAD
ncbi:MAG: endonuclease/exonuclease/phosphatase family protein [Shimia sp.]